MFRLRLLPWEYGVRNLFRRPGRTLLTLFGLALLAPGMTWAQDVADYYRRNCLNCHTIGGGRLTGPDLKDLSQRQKREWLVNFLMDPRSVIASGDAYAQEILQEFRNVPMPNMPGMTRELAESLLDLIEVESRLEKSQFLGRQTADRPFTDDDRSQGHKLFVGEWRLYNGGTACIACHSAPELPALDSGRASTVTAARAQLVSLGELPPLGGGQLGPALTNACERLKGCKALCDWLAPAKSESKHPVFKNHPLEPDEVHALAAYIDQVAGQQAPSSSVGRMTFLLLGLVSATALAFMFDRIGSSSAGEHVAQCSAGSRKRNDRT